VAPSQTPLPRLEPSLLPDFTFASVAHHRAHRLPCGQEPLRQLPTYFSRDPGNYEHRSLRKFEICSGYQMLYGIELLLSFHADGLHRDGRESGQQSRATGGYAGRCGRAAGFYRARRLPVFSLQHRAGGIFRAAPLSQRRRRPGNHVEAAGTTGSPSAHRAGIRQRPLSGNRERPPHARSGHFALRRPSHQRTRP
jgi:hypothetical protein